MTGECACNKQEAKRELAGWLEEGRSSLFFSSFRFWLLYEESRVCFCYDSVAVAPLRLRKNRSVTGQGVHLLFGSP